jgi:hypothetical protein
MMPGSGAAVENLAAGDLAIEVAPDRTSSLTCTWRGKSNERHPGEVLNPWFDRLLDAAAAAGVSITMQFERLEHFNSSTISTLIRLIQNARARGVRLTVSYDQNVRWQRLSFDALRVFDKNDELFQLRSV